MAGLILPAAADPPAMPDPALTPGAVAETDPAVICAPGYDRAHRVWRSQAGTFAKYGVPAAERPDYVDDDRVPVCLGGDNAAPTNHWPQPRAQALVKDRLERRLCRMVCGGEISVPAAQAVFLGDWRDEE